MAEPEENFPRGKVPPAVAEARSATPTKKRKSQDGLQGIFEPHQGDGVKPKKVSKSKHALTPQEQKALAWHRSEDTHQRFSVIQLGYEQVVEGMLSLGIITKIKEQEIVVNLPGRVCGVVNITNISSPYLNMIEKLAKGKAPKDKSIVMKSMADMFYVGQCVVVKVILVDRSEPLAKVKLSMNPRHIHSNFSAAGLQEDLVMITAVSSEEDHGYVMDIGVEGARCFLPMEDADKYVSRSCQNQPLGVGQLVYCKLRKVKFHHNIANVTLTAAPKQVQTQKMDGIIGLNYSTLLPGMLVDTIVMKTCKTGLMGHVLELTGLVHQDHMNGEWQTPDSLEVGATMSARILYILPNLTTPYLTMQGDVVPLAPTRDRADRSRLGSKEKVRVIRTERRGVIVRLEEGSGKGIIPVGHLHESVVQEKDISMKYKLGSVIECRVIQYNAFDRFYICSLKESKLSNEIAHIERVTPGLRVVCKVIKWNTGGAIVSYGDDIYGFIPSTLFRQELLTEAAKAKLIGTSHKALVMSKNAATEKVILTTIKEMVTSRGAVITSLDEAKIGMVGYGVIKWVTPSGAYVGLVGGVEGFIPASKLSKVKLPNICDAFRKGQVLKYKVLEKVREKNQLILTTVIPEDDDDDDRENVKESPRKRKAPEDKDKSGKTAERSKKKKKRKKEAKSAAMGSVIKSESDSEKENPAAKENVQLGLSENNSFWEGSAALNKERGSDSDMESKKSKLEKKKQATATAAVQATSVTHLNKPVGASVSTVPESTAVEELESGILKNPDDAKFWIQLITHYSSIGNVEKARAVGKQALERINFRKEKSKLKVWGARLSLEVKYGNQDTLKNIWNQALQGNDEFECFKMMGLIYEKMNKRQDAERIYQQMVRKFRLEPDAWDALATFHFTNGKQDCARDMFNEALNVVENKNRVLLITKVALLEFQFGDLARGEAMLDRTLSDHPRRTDVWLLYANGLIKKLHYDKARNVFKRALEAVNHPKKAKPVLKRFKEFETQFGNETSLEEFNALALEVLNVAVPT